MGIESVHPEYKKREDDWQTIRDVLDGQRAIKEARTVYLPAPPGAGVTPIGYDADTKSASQDEYDFYLSFAQFPEITENALDRFQGIIHGKLPTWELPDEMKYLEESAGVDGSTLESLWRMTTRIVLSTGRVGFLADVSERDDELRLAAYSAENIRNWREIGQGSEKDLILLVLREFVNREDDEDDFEHKRVTIYRELRLLDGMYQMQKWERSEDKNAAPDDMEPNADIVESMIPIELFGRKFDEIPFVFVNAMDIGQQYGPIPIMPLAMLALSIYRRTADYNRTLYLKGDPQVWFAGVAKEEIPTTIGGGGAWCFKNAQARAEYLDIDGDGIPHMRTAIRDDFEQFDRESGKLLTDKNQVESGEAKRREMISKKVTLKAVVVNAAEGLQHALRLIAKMRGVQDPESVKFVPDLDFAEPMMTPDELAKFQEARLRGAPISAMTIHNLMRKSGVTEMKYEDELAQMQDDIALLPAPSGAFDDTNNGDDPNKDKGGGDNGNDENKAGATN